MKYLMKQDSVNGSFLFLALMAGIVALSLWFNPGSDLKVNGIAVGIFSCLFGIFVLCAFLCPSTSTSEVELIKI